MKVNFKPHKIYGDMILNLAATGLPLVVLQLLIYPWVSRIESADQYGLMITIYSLLVLICDPLGKSLNNIRLINSKEESEHGASSNYNHIMLLYIAVSIVVMIAGTIYYDKELTAVKLLLILMTGICLLVNGYIVVWYRIKLNYKAITVNACFMAAGFLAGFLAYKLTGLWILIFLLGHFASLIFLTRTTKVLDGRYKRENGFRELFHDTNALTFALFLSQGMSLADKLVLMPLLGGYTVSVYYTAAIIGKIMTLTTGPINSVILSYLAKKESLSRKTFVKYLLVCFSFCLALGIVVIILSRPVLGILFPAYVDDAMTLVPFTTVNTLIFVMASMVTPIVMRYCDIVWQTIINVVGFIIYVGASILFLHLWGMIGFCIGIGLSHLVRFVLLLVVYEKATRKKELSMKPSQE